MEVEQLKALYHFIGGIMLAIIVAFLRVLADKEETSWQRILIEAFLCGSITASIISLVAFLDWNMSISGFIGGTVGLVGSVFVRSIARKIIVKKVD